MTQTERPKLITGDKLYEVLEAAGIFRKEDRIRRFVIDARIRDVVVMYVERFGDSRLLDVASTLDGIQIRTVDEVPE